MAKLSIGQMSSTQIGNTNVTVLDLLNAFQNTLWGLQKEELHERLGISYTKIERIVEIRDATEKFWQP